MQVNGTRAVRPPHRGEVLRSATEKSARDRPAARALASREFRLYLFGLVASLAGTYMQQVAEGWLVYRLTNSALALGLVAFVIMIPLAPLTLLSGVIADRFPRRKILFLTQIGQVIPPLVLAALTWSHLVQVWHIVLIDLVMSALTAVDQPVRQALLADTVPSEGLENAIAISASGFNVARVVGPAVGGLLVAALGEAICFAFNGVSFILIAIALAAMVVPDKIPAAAKTSIKGSLVDGVRYLAREPIIAAAIGFMIVINLFIVPYQTLLPVFARDILTAGAAGLGLLVAATGAGAILGSLGIAGLAFKNRGRVLVLLGLGAPVVMVGFTIARDLTLACLALALVSASVVAAKVLVYTFVQARVTDDRRGRIMSVVTLTDAGAPRLGGLFAGIMASLWGAPAALQLGAVSCVLCLVGLNQLLPALRRAP